MARFGLRVKPSERRCSGDEGSRGAGRTTIENDNGDRQWRPTMATDNGDRQCGAANDKFLREMRLPPMRSTSIRARLRVSCKLGAYSRNDSAGEHPRTCTRCWVSERGPPLRNAAPACLHPATIGAFEWHSVWVSRARVLAVVRNIRRRRLKRCMNIVPRARRSFEHRRPLRPRAFR
jgi:hypothetical protein